MIWTDTILRININIWGLRNEWVFIGGFGEIRLLGSRSSERKGLDWGVGRVN